MWQPITLKQLMTYIENLEFLFDERQKRFWDLIKITPQKWKELRMGEEGGGFWAVAVFGNNVMYYNDIEDGFNISSFTTYGKIDEYLCGQIELHDLVAGLHESFTQNR